MTDEQRREHMKEIETQLDKLREERREHEKYFREKNKKTKYEEHCSFTGKCFVTKELNDNKNKHVKAFKVLEVLELNENYARCIILTNGIERNCWDTHSIKIEVLPLWTQNKMSMIYSEEDLKVIDYYREISSDEFDALYRTHKLILDEAAFCEKVKQ